MDALMWMVFAFAASLVAGITAVPNAARERAKRRASLSYKEIEEIRQRASQEYARERELREQRWNKDQ